MEAEKLQRIGSLLSYFYGDKGNDFKAFLHDPSKLRVATLIEAKFALKMALAMPGDDVDLSAESSARIIELIPVATLGELELIYEMLVDLLNSPLSLADKTVINGILSLVEARMADLIPNDSFEELWAFCELAVRLVNSGILEIQGKLSFYKMIDYALLRLNELLFVASFEEALMTYSLAVDMIYDVSFIGMTPIMVEIISKVAAKIVELLPEISIDDVGFVFVAISCDCSKPYSSKDSVISELTAFPATYGITVDLFSSDIKAAALTTIKDRLAKASLEEAEDFCEFVSDLHINDLSDDDILELVIVVDLALARILESLPTASFNQVIDIYEIAADMIDIELLGTLSQLDDVIDVSLNNIIKRLPEASFKEILSAYEVASDLVGSEYATESVLVDGIISVSSEKFMELLPQSSYDEAESLHDLATRSSDLILEVAALKRIFDLA
jgi:hypothetical protein